MCAVSVVRSFDRALKQDKQLVVVMLGINLSNLLRGSAARFQALTIDAAVDCCAISIVTFFVFFPSRQ